MASGRSVNLHHGARFVLAESLGVPPGLLCRRANTIFVAKTSGFIISPGLEMNCGVRGRVGILPVEYYTDMIVTFFEHYGVQIGMDSSVILGGDIAFDLETRDIVHIDYFSGRYLIFFDSGGVGCAPVCLTAGSDYRFAPNLVLLRAAGSRRGGRCSKAMWHVCARWRGFRCWRLLQSALVASSAFQCWRWFAIARTCDLPTTSGLHRREALREVTRPSAPRSPSVGEMSPARLA